MVIQQSETFSRSSFFNTFKQQQLELDNGLTSINFFRRKKKKRRRKDNKE